MSEQLLTILKLCLLGLLYLFFFRVVRAVWAELRAPAPAPAGPTPARPAPAAAAASRPKTKGRGVPTELLVTEPPERRGITYPIGDELTVGRAGGCAISLPDDTYVSNLHARVFTSNGKVLVEDLGSTNGTYVNREKLTAPVPLARGDRLQVGSTVLEGAITMTELRAGGLTDPGRVRQVNQDAPLLADGAELWAVADGMGGHNGGEVASDLAIQALRTYYTGEERTLDALLDAATAANSAINEAATDDPELRGMGTTLVAIAHTDDDELAFVNIGDSRIYLFRGAELSRLTIDHSLVEELVREGQITPEEARTHPKRNIVTRALGIEPWARIDSNTIIPYTGDRYVLCSDGLFNEVDDDRIASVLRRLADPDDAASELVRLANEGGGRDNITVVVVDVLDDGGRAEAGSAAAVSTASSSVDDPAGFTAVAAAAPARDPEPKLSRRERRRQKGAPRRLTWRVAAFLVLVLALLAGAAAAIYQEARGGYFVAFDENGFVTVYRGSPGGVLWIDPVVERTTDITHDQVPPNLRDELDEGLELSNEARVDAFLQQQVTTTTSTSTTTTTSTTSTTVVPVAPVVPTSVP